MTFENYCKKAGLFETGDFRDIWEAAQKEEREACAKLCDDYAEWCKNWGMYSNEVVAVEAAKECAGEIRMRPNV